jgi:Transposase domain (DUF772)
MAATADFFRARLDGMVDHRHPLVVLSKRLPWAALEQALAPHFARQPRPRLAKQVTVDLLGAHEVEFGNGISNAGRPRLSIRLMSSLQYLKNSFNLSDEELVQRWSENVVWQFFSGMQYYKPRLPCDPTQTPCRGRRRSGAVAQGHHRDGGRDPSHQAQRAGACDRGHHGTGEGYRPPGGQSVARDCAAQGGQCGQTSGQDLGRVPKQVVVDLGFRGVEADNPNVEIIHRGKYKSLTKVQRKWLKRRQAIEPLIGHYPRRTTACSAVGSKGS